MKDHFDSIENLKPFVSLTETERVAMRQEMQAFLRANPVKETATTTERMTVFQLLFGSWQRGFAFALALIVMFVAVGGGTALAAERSLPGDTLYPFKVGITEELRSAFIRSDRERAEWESERISRRLAEVQALVAREGSVDAHSFDIAEGYIERHSQAMLRSTETLERRGDVDGLLSVVGQLQGSLEEYTALLRRIIAEQGDAADPNLQTLLGRVSQAEQAAKSAQLSLSLSQRDQSELPLNTDIHTEFVSPASGDQLVNGSYYDISWRTDATNASFITVELLDTRGNVLGLVASQRMTNQIRWNPEYVSTRPIGNPLSVVPGQYRLKLTIETSDGQRSIAESALFSVAREPEEQSGAGFLVILVKQPQGTIVAGSSIMIVDSTGKTIEKGYSGTLGYTANNLPAGRYTVYTTPYGSTTEFTKIASVIAGQTSELEIRVPDETSIASPEVSKYADLWFSAVSPYNINYIDQFGGYWTVDMTYTIKNSGSQSIFTSDFGHAITTPGDPRFDYVIASSACAQAKALLPNESCFVQATLKFNQPGTHNVLLTLRTDKPEVSKNNNTAETTIILNRPAPSEVLSVTWQQPAPSTTWVAGQQYILMWNTQGNVSSYPGYIRYTSESGAYTSIDNNLPSLIKGSYSWEIPAGLSPGMYELVVGFHKGNGAVVESRRKLTIVAPEIAPPTPATISQLIYTSTIPFGKEVKIGSFDISASNTDIELSQFYYHCGGAVLPLFESMSLHKDGGFVKTVTAYESGGPSISGNFSNLDAVIKKGTSATFVLYGKRAARTSAQTVSCGLVGKGALVVRDMKTGDVLGNSRVTMINDGQPSTLIFEEVVGSQ